MKTVALLLSHVPTPEQESELMDTWGAGLLRPLPEPLQKRWSQIPPVGPFPADWLRFVLDWLAEITAPGDLVWIQGEPGAVLLAVSWCCRNGRIPVYATTRREYQSTVLPDGSIRNQHIFHHVNFRRYPCPDER